MLGSSPTSVQVPLMSTCSASGRSFDPNTQRQENGRFVPADFVRDESRRRQIEKSRSYSARKERLGRVIYEGILKVTFLKGADEDWIPTSSSTGPLVELADALIRPSFLISKEDRKDKAHLPFFGGDPGKVRKIVERVQTRDADASWEYSRITAYKGRRYPLLENYSFEIEAVRTWLEEIDELGALKISTVADAFSLCLRPFKRYVLVNGKRAYKEYPNQPRLKLLPRVSTPTAEQTANEQRVESETGTAERVESSRGNTDEQTPRSDEITERSANASGSANDSVEEMEEVTTEVDSFAQETCDLFDLAYDDDAFLMICLLFDTRTTCRLVMIAGPYVENFRNDPDLLRLIQQILIYSHWKCYKIKNPEEHQKREAYLKDMAKTLTELREHFGLAPYEDMRWPYI